MAVQSIADPITVLFIDDNFEDLERWSQALTDTSPGYSILQATNEYAGLRLFQNQKIHCVVLDLDLAGGSGFEVLFNLIPDRRRPQIAVVVLTRLMYPNLHEMLLHNGAQACLVKQHTSAIILDESIRNAIASIQT
jgi:CheY-like chemotaxis protein